MRPAGRRILPPSVRGGVAGPRPPAATTGAVDAIIAGGRRLSASASASPPSRLVVPVELVSDTLWPNGYIGKRHLETAMRRVLSAPLSDDASSPELAFAVVRVPFFLEPDYDESKPFIESNRERLVKKWGGTRGWEIQKLRHDLKGRGLAAGIPHFNLDRLASNSMASHRLIQHVGKRYGLHVSEALYDRLNVYYFVEGHALNDRPRLARVAAETLSASLEDDDPTNDDEAAIMSEEEILTFLDGDEGRPAIERALRTLNQLGVHGIPKFIVEGSTVVDGAAGPDTFVSVFRDIERRGRVAGGPIFGDILGVSKETVERGSHTRESLLLEKGERQLAS